MFRTSKLPIPTILSVFLIQSAARANALPVDFFARLIWQESRFQPDEIGPITRTGQRAQGIAQFMPGTAEERRLYEPLSRRGIAKIRRIPCGTS